jgi:outer membrane lipopolysaccharide assembly protein LptE/RlpB
MRLHPIAACAALAAALLAPGCGYHVSGHADALPKTIHTIAVPAFGNATTHYRLTESLPAAITREFIARTRYNVTADTSTADAILSGSVLRITSSPTTYDQVTGRASAVQMYIQMQITLRDRAGKVLYSRPYFEFRERYEISTDQRAYLEESDVALDRMSQAVARMVVSAILEKF